MNGGLNMELARLSSKGQITVPIEIRKRLNLKEGDKVLFFEDGGKIVVANASIMALKEIQASMNDEAEKQGFKSEKDVNDYVKEIRKELWEKKYENND
jgi:AbrB family looped-hinge helix DNA binding protein